MDTSVVFVTIAVVGFTEFVRRLKDKDYYAALTIAGAVVIGASAGFFNVEGLTVSTGIIAGLAGSGAVTLATRAGGNPPLPKETE